MPYIDGFLIPVRNQDRDRYREHELQWWPMFKGFGALTLVVGWGDDVPAGTHTDFRRAVDLQPDETVVFSWITWPDKETRDRAHARMMDEMPEVEMPFDGKRMVYGGFAALIDER
ncbi:DUF1428 domain-containing protein [Tabrizicola sp. BL-A-41-H6]|uniref:DUF1428 domain-containing protein n=1 Tax=Tabrizicola sp. BL-A-41-H6 TaxID=3421107 RepID=UPI003D66C20D